MSVRDFEARIAAGDRARRDGEFSAAEAAYREALRMAEEDAGARDGEFERKHLAMAEVLCKLGRLYQSMGRGLESTLSFRKCLRIFSSVSGDEYFQLAVARDRRAVPQS
ncbi:MAG: hypothetical protein HY820_38650 [Acidobacteria bacterium]|nr:hypothetical protein [Acidobacteriota bacterium]